MIGVVADDITGANDIGIMFAKSNYVTHVYPFEPGAAFRAQGGPDVVILDTDSRFDSAKTAYDKAYAATRQLADSGCTFFYNKTCSVFRGNVGAEFDAMLDALGESFMIVVLGFPKNGRTTVDGIHYVHGRKLEESEFRHDPVHPMRRSDLVGILQAQTRRSVERIGRETVERGAEALREAIAARKANGPGGYLLLDVTDQAALAAIAEAVRGERVVGGSSALAEELALAWGAKPAGEASRLPLAKRDGVGILCAAGSLMPQTAAQIAELKRTGVAGFELDTMRLLDEASREAEIGRLTAELSAVLEQGRNALYHSSNEAERVARTKEAGARAGLTNTDVSRLVSGAIAEIAARVLERTGENRLLVAGGDTSAAVCARLGVKGMRVWKEIESGLPSCVSLSDRPVLLVLKSGSFGKPDFFVRALEHLKTQ
ncbi:four-carbon acid sugar kinase family protein [Paenibacillus flagellatus]|uniref:Serine kinase n=1 Tax=Paenibacillus flagellatus TaxID=2211139 RepID=A0A2V5KGY3_9BACL|nr:four-carbon acid sugar kinase family protein [Paenibacillus flagellatus]PYI53530.1 serine kinase [Paenibacillus flagellatus]